MAAEVAQRENGSHKTFRGKLENTRLFLLLRNHFKIFLTSQNTKPTIPVTPPDILHTRLSGVLGNLTEIRDQSNLLKSLMESWWDNQSPAKK